MISNQIRKYWGNFIIESKQSPKYNLTNLYWQDLLIFESENYLLKFLILTISLKYESTLKYKQGFKIRTKSKSVLDTGSTCSVCVAIWLVNWEGWKNTRTLTMSLWPMRMLHRWDRQDHPHLIQSTIDTKVKQKKWKSSWPDIV